MPCLGSFWGVQSVQKTNSEQITTSFTSFLFVFFRKKQSDRIKNSIVTSRDSLKSCDEHITIRLVIFRYYSFYNFFFREIFDLKFIPYGFCYYYVPTMLALLTNLPINLNLLRLKMISFLYIASNSHG